MGYEFFCHYHERLGDGSYDKDQIKTMKKRVGQAEEEVACERLAGAIMAQLARRDVWVLDVEVYEFSKKKISFRETKGGLVIGNKKYGLDDCGQYSVQEAACEPEARHKPGFRQDSLPPQYAQHGQDGSVNIADLQLTKRKPIRYEIFQPDPVFVDPQKVRTLAFTVGDKYPIYQERPAGNDPRLGMNYTTLDNQGRKQVLNDKHFVPAGNLIGGDQFNDRRDVALHFGDDGGFDLPMPKVRE